RPLSPHFGRRPFCLPPRIGHTSRGGGPFPDRKIPSRRHLHRDSARGTAMSWKLWAWPVVAVLGLWSAGTASAAHFGSCSYPGPAICAEQCQLPCVRYRVCYRPEVETHTKVCYRPVYNTVVEQERYTVCRREYETCYREHRYTVCRPVTECYEVEQRYT